MVLWAALGVVLFIAIVIGLVFGLKMAKFFIKALILISTVITIGLIIFGVLVFLDFREFSQNDSRSAYYLSVGNESLLAGFSMNNSHNVIFMEDKEVSAKGSLYRQGNYSGILGTEYKIFIVDFEFLSQTNLSVQLFEKSVDCGIILNCIKSDDAELKKCIYALAGSSNREVLTTSTDSTGAERARSMLFASVMSQLLLKKPYRVIEGINSGLIKVYPETPMFVAMKMVPAPLFRKFFSKDLKADIENLKVRVTKNETSG